MPCGKSFWSWPKSKTVAPGRFRFLDVINIPNSFNAFLSCSPYEVSSPTLTIRYHICCSLFVQPQKVSLWATHLSICHSATHLPQAD